MKNTQLWLKYSIFIILSIFSINCNAEIPVKEIQSVITTNHPIYDIPEGQFNNVLNGLKTYNLFVLVTSSDPKYNCALCNQFDPVYEQLVRSVYRKFPILKDRVIFTRIEATKHLDGLKELGIKSIPQIWGFPDSKRILGEEKFDKIYKLLKEMELSFAKGEEFIEPDWYNLNQAGMEHYTFEMNQGDNWGTVIVKFVEFLSSTTTIDLRSILEDSKKENSIDWFITIQWFTYILVGIKIFQKLRETSEDGTKFWQDRKIYAYLSIVLIFIFISGFNFTLQRHSPFISNLKGKLLWVAPVNNNQFGSEIVITILLQIGFFITFILMLNNKYVFEDRKSQNWATIIGSILMLTMLILGVNVYYLKDRGYPYNYIKIF